MTKHHDHLPTPRQLFKATGIALVTAGALLVTAVLPAEFGIDPTGVGNLIGLAAMKPAVAEATPRPVESATVARSAMASATVTPSEPPLRADEMSVALQPGEGAEIKATMREGEQFVFQWTTEGGTVNFDMHGERFNAGDAFTSYLKGTHQKGDQGTFVAPFDGTHGWFWRNRGDQAVTVTVRVNGFHEKLARVK